MVKSAASALRNPGVYFGVFFMVVLSVVAYQARRPYSVAIGSPQDRGLISGFHEAEFVPPESGLPYTRFRWSEGATSYLYFDGVGKQDFDAELAVNGTRPPGAPPATLRISGGDAALLQTEVPPGVSVHRFHVPRQALDDGSLALKLETNPFNVPGDRRELGIIVLRMDLTPDVSNDRFVEPHFGTIAALTGAVGLLCVLLALMGWGPGAVAAAGAALSLLASGLIAFDRLWLTQRGWFSAWPQALLVGAVLVVLCWWPAGPLLAAGGVGWSPRQRRALLTLVLVVFAVRLAGQLHPSIFVYDLGFHANILRMVESGQLLFTTQPAEFGGTGHPTFYLPTTHILIAPLHWLLSDDRLAIGVFTAAAGTLGALPVYYIAARATRGVRTGLFAAALYLLFPISVVIFSWGITSNIFGELVALCTLAVFVGTWPALSPRRPAFWALTALSMLALLSHPGVLALFAVAIVLWSLVALWVGHDPAEKRGALWSLGALALAVIASFVIYFRHFVPEVAESLARIGAERGGPGTPHVVGGSVEDVNLGLFQRPVNTLGEWLSWGLRGFWAELQAYYRVWPLVAAALGLVLLWHGLRRGSLGVAGRALLAGAGGWFASVALLALVGWTVNVYVRYMLFALPVVALGSGALLAHLSARGRWGLPLGLLVVVFFAFQALVFWQYRINFAFK